MSFSKTLMHLCRLHLPEFDFGKLLAGMPYVDLQDSTKVDEFIFTKFKLLLMSSYCRYYLQTVSPDINIYRSDYLKNAFA